MTATPDGTPQLQLVPLPGSERATLPGVESTTDPVDPRASVEMTLVLRRKAPLPDPVTSPRLSREELAASYGADEADIELVTETLTALGLHTLGVDAATRRMRVEGPLERVSQVLGATVAVATSPGPDGRPVTHRYRTGALSVPAQLDGIVTAVLGLDDRPQARTLSVRAQPAAVATSYTPLELGTVYAFPTDADGTGQTIAIIELGGGFVQSDLDAYFAELGITGPSVRAVGVDGAGNDPDGNPSGNDGEVVLDIEVAGALAPGADIVVYFAPNTDAGFLDAIAQAAQSDPTPAAMSISWGQSEVGWTQQGLTSMDDAVADAVTLGITVLAASGDDGSADRVGDGAAHVDFPASSPHVLGCGGTRLQADGSTGAVTSETVWNTGPGEGASGGGVSDVFPLPVWQQSAGVPDRSGGGQGRGVPDVAADADPSTGYRVRVDGSDMVIGGTSAVAPLWAALVARFAQSAGKPLGLLQPLLYAGVEAGLVANGFRDVTEGNNGAYDAGPGWDACTGLGVPDGEALVGVVQPAGG
jgi:kumamolisin